jgi:hypothetical protein
VPRGDHLVRAYDDDDEYGGDGELRLNDDDDAASPRRSTGRIGEAVDT